MSTTSLEPADLLDLKLLPAWVKESAAADLYSDFPGHEEQPDRPRERDRGPGRDRRSKPGSERASERRQPRSRPPRSKQREQRRDRPQVDRPARAPEPPLELTVRFLPNSTVLENVVTQIKSQPLAYSLFALARLFLEKPQRYLVHVTTAKPFFQLGEEGPISPDQTFLENNAFRFAQDKFYKVEVTQSDPIKGNFSSVAQCRLSGQLLGPTNHHAYQPRLRSLYEQRFSRRMSFPDYQRQIEIVSDPAVVERWKEEARKITTFATLDSEPSVTFNTASEAERHFRQNYLPGLVRTIDVATIDGVSSRQLADRRLHRHVETAWSAENRSPSNMMQELAKQFREAGLNIFRHRRGMLFVSSIRARPLVHDETNLSTHVKEILEAVAATPRIHRKDLADKLLAGLAGDDQEARKLALASDLRWLISEGYVIEFNDGSLDLPKVKAKPAAEKKPDAAAAAESSTAPEQPAIPATPASVDEPDPEKRSVGSTESRPSENNENSGKG